MAQSRSPGYPSMSLPEAVDLVGKLYEANRVNITDREAAAKDMGYSGLSGTSAKALADLMHYGLTERAGKGGLRVSQATVDILYPDNPDTRQRALREAASGPVLFASLDEQFEGGHYSSNALRAYLMRNGYASAAIPSIMRAYADTILFLRQEGGSESHSATASTPTASAVIDPVREEAPASPAPRQRTDGVKLMDGERVIFMDEVGPDQYLKVVAAGELDDQLLEAMEDFTKRRRKRFEAAVRSVPVATDDDDL